MRYPHILWYNIFLKVNANNMQGFKQFIMRGNAVDLAVGVVFGAAFGTIVNSFVNGLVTPLIGAMVKAPDFSELYFTVNSSKFMYGNLINAVISFLIIATTIYFFVVLPINKLRDRMNRNAPVPEPTTKICPQCQSEIPLLAKRCKFCTSVVE
jgi:large conductance mechanosensitive channel